MASVPLLVVRGHFGDGHHLAVSECLAVHMKSYVIGGSIDFHKHFAVGILDGNVAAQLSADTRGCKFQATPVDTPGLHELAVEFSFA